MGIRSVAAALTFAVLAAACGGGEGGDGTTTGGTGGGGIDGQTVSVALREFTLDAQPATAAPGQIRFEARNTGGIPHELVVIATDLSPDGLPAEGGAVDEEAEGISVAGRIEEFAPGISESLALDLEAGAYVLVCNIPGHYQAGMAAPLVVG